MTKEQELLAARLEDYSRLGQKRPCFLGFLDEAQAAFCEDFLSRCRVSTLFWGGYEEAERVMVGFFPEYLEPAPRHFPIVPLSLSYGRNLPLSPSGIFLGPSWPWVWSGMWWEIFW